MTLCTKHKKIKKFSDFPNKPKILDGEKVKIDDILDKEIIITGYKMGTSKFNTGSDDKKYLTVQFEYPDTDNHFVFFTGSSILQEQLTTYGDEIPFSTTLKRVKNFLTLS